MERLTIPDEKIDGGECRTVIDARKVKEHAMTIYWALKKYEDTDLTPPEIMELKERAQGEQIRRMSAEEYLKDKSRETVKRNRGLLSKISTEAGKKSIPGVIDR